MLDRDVAKRVAELVAVVSDGHISAVDALVPGRSLGDLGLTSIGYLRLIDAVEDEYNILIDVDELGEGMFSVQGLTDFILSDRTSAI